MIHFSNGSCEGTYVIFSVEKTTWEMHEMRITAFGVSSMGGAVIF